MLRGSDGRSLAAALAWLMLVAALVAGIHSGAAASGTETVLCAHAATDGGSRAPADHADPCCITGNLTSAVGTGGVPALLPLPSLADGRAIVLPAKMTPPTVPAFGQHAPRGPPSLA